MTGALDEGEGGKGYKGREASDGARGGSPILGSGQSPSCVLG